MKHDEFEKLKINVNEKTFHSNYGVFSKLSNYISYVGNIFSILFAYFFLVEIASSALLNPTALTTVLVSVASILILFTIELSKRFIFDKFSLSIIKENFTFSSTESKVLGFISLFIVIISFYFSLSGAKKYSDRDDDLVKNTETVVDKFQDSLNLEYSKKIDYIDNLNKKLITQNNQYDSLISIYETSQLEITGSTWKDNVEKSRYNELISNKKKDKKTNQSEIDKNDTKIKQLKTERDGIISDYEGKQKNKTEKTIEKNSDNPLIFIIFSSVIEIVILFGVYFINYYKIRSVRDYELKIKKDPRYKIFNIWNNLLSIIYTNESQTGDLLPFKTEIIKLIKTNNFDISNKELDDALRMFTHLDILKKKGSKKAINYSLEDAKIKIKEHFKIE